MRLGEDPSLESPPPAKQLCNFEALTVYPPGSPPISWQRGQVLAAGIHETGNTFVVCVDDEGRQHKFVNIPFHSVERPTGLVAA